MVKTKVSTHLLPDGSVDLNAWLDHIHQKHPLEDSQVIRSASILCQLAGQDKTTETGQSCLQQSLAMAEVLADLNLDPDVIAAAIVYVSVQFAELSLEDVEEQLGAKIAKLVSGVERMSAIDYIRKTGVQNHLQLNNLRKMLLAMIDDVRVVLIKITERLIVLRTISNRSATYRKALASDIMAIYAPLANRLGIGQLKWELEDLAFRYLEQDIYKSIASGLKERRVDRDHHVNAMVSMLEEKLEHSGLRNFSISGRAKHIHSIYHKMQRKNIDLQEIYDANAVRVLVETEANCYQVLSLVHHKWDCIEAEFDDYIANPKNNGYRSLHTAVIGPHQRIFEVQIRTYQMHAEAELGVCAHWAYKEGHPSELSNTERKIAWMREVLQWQLELSQGSTPVSTLSEEMLDDRLYIFTPTGDIVDLSQGATPLDFAYAIHTEVGHRCRGAKVNGTMVPLTHTLQTGDQVEILTHKNGHPSRDWLSHDTQYIKTSRARAKVLQWFKMQNYDQNVEEGKQLLQRECRRLNLQNVKIEPLTQQFRYENTDDFYAALGRGDIRRRQVINRILPPRKSPPKTQSKMEPAAKNLVVVDGVGRLLTQFAKCCAPKVGDDIIGYITLTRGISIHKSDCANILNTATDLQKRLINVHWGTSVNYEYAAQLAITAYDRQGLLNDITHVVQHYHALLNGVQSRVDTQGVAHIQIGVKVQDSNALSDFLEHLSNLNNVTDVKRIT